MASLAAHARHHRFHARYWLVGMVLLLVAVLVAGRLYLNVWLPRYVNQVLNNIEGYKGSVEDIDIALYRGAYRIHGLKIYKRTGKIPTPFVDIEMADLSIQWGALLRGRIVSNIDLQKPIINFASNESTSQTGAGVDWTKPIMDLMPIDINLVTFRQGRLSYQDFSESPKVDVYMHNMSGEARNLRNVEDTSKSLPSTLNIRGDSIGGGKLDIRGRMNILRAVPDMDLNVKLEHVNLTALSNYSNAYAGIEIKKGDFNLYSEFRVNNNQVSGYAKPIANNMELIDLRQADNPLQAVWEVLVATVVDIFSNQRRDQFATVIPLEGSLEDVETNTWAAIGGIIRNAFVDAFEKEFSRE